MSARRIHRTETDTRETARTKKDCSQEAISPKTTNGYPYRGESLQEAEKRIRMRHANLNRNTLFNSGTI